eukprot:TRINITY_DN1788_c0_g1_i2.p1 TRINITY_DN1788_c0_g1~~TRINITY_DN1788_c0_g1_i2.p1  ORF type:complete len:449 (+),score=68.64 TRINITY_DN1788_c0_g1_i2:443-1789(+)
MAHPSHMHGHSFYILAEDAGTINVEQNGNVTMGCENGIGTPASYCNDEETLSGQLVCPQYWGDCSFPNGLPPLKSAATAPRKDTIVIPPHGYVIIGIRSDNPGWWIWHCHIEGHLAAGMGLLLNEANPELEELVAEELPADFPRCGDFFNTPRTAASSIAITTPRGGSISLENLFTRFRFEVNVPFSTPQVTIDVDGSDFGVHIVINGVVGNSNEVALLMGSNGVIIQVSIENDPGSERTYFLNIVRQFNPDLPTCNVETNSCVVSCQSDSECVGSGLGTQCCLNGCGQSCQNPDQGGCQFDASKPGYLKGYACGDANFYDTAEEAKAACCSCNNLGVCNGITCRSGETACTIRSGSKLVTSGYGEVTMKIPRPDHGCSFGILNTGKFLRGYACGDATRYADLVDAQHECCNCDACTGITAESSGLFTIRSGSDLTTSPTNEDTYLKT